MEKSHLNPQMSSETVKDHQVQDDEVYSNLRVSY